MTMLNDVDIDAALNSLLGKSTTAEIVDKIREKLKSIVLPWRKNNWSPPQWVRMTADGKQVGLVDSWLGGYGSPHRPREHGWGYKGDSPRGHGQCTSGIVEVDTANLVTDQAGVNVEELKKCEENARLDAMQRVDEFLRQNFPGLILLEEDQ